MKLTYSFKNPALLKQALTHPSWVSEHPGLQRDNERMEWLGDAVVQLIVSDLLQKRFPEASEGWLSKMRQKMVDREALSLMGSHLGLGPELYLGIGEKKEGGQQKPSLLADAFEALVGAIYMDGGLEAALGEILPLMEARLEHVKDLPVEDAKSQLQQYTQRKWGPLPRYELVEQLGPDHDRRFVVDVLLPNEKRFQGKGRSKHDAEILAATAALAELPPLPETKAIDPRNAPQDPKSRLQYYCQSLGDPPPSYAEISRGGPSHAPHFVVSVELPFRLKMMLSSKQFKGEGNSKKLAERQAAELALAALEQHLR